MREKRPKNLINQLVNKLIKETTTAENTATNVNARNWNCINIRWTRFR